MASVNINEQVQVETAEGIYIELQPAGIAVRTLAFSFDLLLRFAAFILIAIIGAFLGEFGTGLMLIVIFLLEWFYPILFEHYTGSTPGKKIFGLKVVYSNGLPLTLPGAMTRNLFRAIDFLPFGYLSGALSMLFTRRFQRIGDWVADTMVVYEPHTDTFNLSTTESQYQPPFLLTTQEQVAVIHFAERSEKLSASRASELADILKPALNTERDAKDCLKALANRYVGK
ncbi:RDD family protein [Catenovulum adriaticum]|uniref:RDD family protein n=1 Tax=Catenovulum adriaticum TaxID=2984846 RepID=A0ABY7ASE4_9ALTE|nr:RDD family protein [Catenovulum sp. TS8]WAJ72188.1 RDD family protein [Catenovulum sp. TS8]